MARGPDRTLDVLLCFLKAPPEGLGVTEVALALDLYKSNVHRTLQTLAARGLVREEPRGRRYRLGYAALALGGAFLSASDLVQAALPELAGLHQACGAAAELWVADGPEQVCLAGTGPALAAMGRRKLLLPGASGLALLAFADAVERAGLLGALAGRLEVQMMALVEELEQVRRRGWAEAADGVAAPVWRGRAIAGAVAVACAPECAAQVVAAAGAMAGRL